jgi:hypothetical protein
MPLRKLSTAPSPEKSSAIFEQHGAPFLVVNAARCAYAEDGQGRAACARPRLRVPFDLVNRRASCVLFRHEASRSDEDDVVSGGREGCERRTRHDGEGQSSGSHRGSNLRQKGARVGRIARDTKLSGLGVPLAQPALAQSGRSCVGIGTDRSEPLASEGRERTRSGGLTEGRLEQQLAHARLIRASQSVAAPVEQPVRLIERAANACVRARSVRPPRHERLTAIERIDQTGAFSSGFEGRERPKKSNFSVGPDEELVEEA